MERYFTSGSEKKAKTLGDYLRSLEGRDFKDVSKDPDTRNYNNGRKYRVLKVYPEEKKLSIMFHKTTPPYCNTLKVDAVKHFNDPEI